MVNDEFNAFLIVFRERCAANLATFQGLLEAAQHWENPTFRQNLEKYYQDLFSEAPPATSVGALLLDVFVAIAANAAWDLRGWEPPE